MRAARSTNGAVRFLGVLLHAKRSPNRFSVCYTGRFLRAALGLHWQTPYASRRARTTAKLRGSHEEAWIWLLVDFTPHLAAGQKLHFEATHTVAFAS